MTELLLSRAAVRVVDNVVEDIFGVEARRQHVTARLERMGTHAEAIEFVWPWPCHHNEHIYAFGDGRCVECGTPDFDALDIAGIRGVLSPR